MSKKHKLSKVSTGDLIMRTEEAQHFSNLAGSRITWGSVTMQKLGHRICLSNKLESEDDVICPGPILPELNMLS